MDQEPPISDIDRIPLKERNLVQYFVAQHFNEKPVNLTDDEWHEETLARFKTVSDIIDNTKNKSIRDLIMSGKYEEAAKLVIEILEEKENLLVA